MANPQMSTQLLKPIAGIVLALLILFVPLPEPKTQPENRLFRIEASQYAYNPGILKVNKGDEITIELLATDVVHGIYIDGYELQTSADPGQIATLTFTADRPGLFRFRCIVPCGQLHPFMLGKLQIGNNLLLVRAILMVAVAFVSFFLWKTPLQLTSI